MSRIKPSEIRQTTSLEQLIDGVDTDSPKFADCVKATNKAQAHGSTVAQTNHENAVSASLVQQQCADDYAKLGVVIPGFRARSGQQDIMRLCADTALEGTLLAVQAGTGVGKTFGYVLGCLPMLREADKRLVISTNTVALQSQLIDKDLPFLQTHLFPDLKVAVAKGSNRYLCPRRLDTLSNSIAGKKTESADLLGEEGIDNVNAKALSGHQVDMIKLIDQAFKDQGFDGDLDTLTFKGANSVLSLINRDPLSCPGASSCSKGSTCPFYIQSKKVKDAHIVVTNHAQLSQAGIRGVSMLSQSKGHLDKSIIVVDEAHKLAEVYRDAHTATLDLDQIFVWLKNAAGMQNKTITLFKKIHLNTQAHDADLNRLLMLIESKADDCKESMLELKRFLTDNFETLQKEALKAVPTSEVKLESDWVLSASKAMNCHLTTLLQRNQLEIHRLEKAIEELRSLCSTMLSGLLQTMSSSARSAVGVWVSSVKNLEYTLMDVYTCLVRYSMFDELKDEASRAESGLARWISRKQGKNLNFLVQSNTLDISESFQSTLVQTSHAMILTSATLKSLGGFDFFNDRLGIKPWLQEHRIEEVASPFDYSKTRLSIAGNAPDVGSDKHPYFIKQKLEQLSSRHQAILVLFTSNQQMQKTYELCQQGLLKDRVLSQHAYSKSELISLHKARVDEGQLSLVFGVDSLYEGVDLQGRYLTCVVVTKLPFPNTFAKPLLSYESDCIAFLQGQWAPFNTLSMPMCSMKLVQGVGRLVRTETDAGEVHILDSRLHHSSKKGRNYRQRLLRELPMKA